MMAKILYGIPSEGMGHVTRSKEIITHLLEQGHDVRVATSDRAYEFLSKSFPKRLYKIEGFHLAYEQGKVDKWASFTQILKNAPKSLKQNIERFQKVNTEFAPDVVISDFESFTYFFAKYHRLPLLSIDNMQVINRCDMGLSVPKNWKNDYQLAKAIIKAKVPGCDGYLISSFFEAKIIKKNTQLIPPILRNKILDAHTSTADHILVYQTSSSQSDLLRELKLLPGQKFRVYGLNRDEDLGNVQLKKFSEDGFISDLESSKAVVTNGGFSLISEAVYLHKPICSFPIQGQFEQYVNGAQIERMGYGRVFDEFKADSIKAFLFDLNGYQKAISKYKQNGNKVTLESVNRFITNKEWRR